MSVTVVQLLRVLAVLALLIAAAALATPRGRLPLALRGVYRIMKRDGVLRDRDASAASAAPLWKRVVAFVLVLVAAGLALL